MRSPPKASCVCATLTLAMSIGLNEMVPALLVLSLCFWVGTLFIVSTALRWRSLPKCSSTPPGAIWHMVYIRNIGRPTAGFVGFGAVVPGGLILRPLLRVPFFSATLVPFSDATIVRRSPHTYALTYEPGRVHLLLTASLAFRLPPSAQSANG